MGRRVALQRLEQFGCSSSGGIGSSALVLDVSTRASAHAV